jgi:hypothetical protein
MLNKEYPRLKKKKYDVNDYILGRIGIYNVAIICFLVSLLGSDPAAIIIKDMMHSFPIKFDFIIDIDGNI